MPADSTTPKSKRTQLTNRPKLLLAPGTDSQRPKARAKPAGKTGTGPHRDNHKRPHRIGQARPTSATGPKSRQPARRSNKRVKKRKVGPRQVCFEILVAVAEGAQLDAAMNVKTSTAEPEAQEAEAKPKPIEKPSTYIP